MDFNDNPDTGSGGQVFLKLKDKESIKGVFRGQPLSFHTHWLGKKTIPCTKEGCVLCKEGNQPRYRFRINFLVKEESGYVAKIFEQGPTVYQLMKDLNKDYPLEKTVVKISRTGSGMNDTAYSILPIPKGDITPGADAMLSKIELNDLRPEAPKEESSSHGDFGILPEEDDISF